MAQTRGLHFCRKMEENFIGEQAVQLKSIKHPKEAPKSKNRGYVFQHNSLYEVLMDLSSKLLCPIICHVHENEYAFKSHFGKYLTKNYISLISRFITVSESTDDNLVNNYHVPKEKTIQIYEFISLQKFKSPHRKKEIIKQELNISDTEFVVGASGYMCWRKGTDVYLQLGTIINKIKPNNTSEFVIGVG